MLTDTAIKNAKPKAKSYRLSDSGGLYLEVSPAGGKLWRWKYRCGGKEKRLALGTYPIIRAPAARAMVMEARELLRSGVDPSAAKKARKHVSHQFHFK